jgi:hypothetical protein
VVRGIYEEIKLVNPERAAKIELNLNDNPNPIRYIDCKLSELKKNNFNEFPINKKE